MTVEELVVVGRNVQLSCFRCAYSAPLDLPLLARQRLAAQQPLHTLLAKGLIRCPDCDTSEVMLVSPEADGGDGPLVISRNPHPAGLLASEKNVEIYGSAKSVFIPYSRDGKAPERRAPYCDLKQNPEALASFPEVIGAAQASADHGGTQAFSRLLRRVNGLPSLTTLGCGWETSPYEDQYLTYGYLDISRYPLGERSFAEVRRLAEALMGVLGEAADPSVKYLLTVKVGIHQLRPIFVLDAEAVAAGDTARQAFLTWERALDQLGDALVQVAAQS